MSEDLLIIIALTLAAGIAMPIGALLANANIIHTKLLETEIKHGVIAFGGGALLSAIALVLVPEGVKELSIVESASYFIGGGFFFMLLDVALYKLKTSASQLMAMLADFVPESLALGATFAVHQESAYLLAALMALQNMPEGLNAFDELKKNSHYSAKQIMVFFCCLAIFGPLAGISGYIWLVNYPDIVAAIMLFAAGGILYTVFQDIAPQVPLKKHWLPPIGAVLGFALGIIGYVFTT